MRKDRGRWIGLAAAMPVGIVFGFLFVLGPLFTDGPSSPFDPERLASLALTAGLYLVAAGALSWVSRGDWPVLSMLDLPAAALAFWYAVGEPGIAGLAAAYLALVVLATLAARVLALRFRRARDAAGIGKGRGT